MKHKEEKSLLQLLKEYEKGKIGSAKILKITCISSDELLEKIVELDIECPITPEIDDYTTLLTEELINKTKLAAKK
ncbi:MAG: hypothetical protein JW776_09160 [Candidatus Lokiarchaeota archaeon]|nr:hypothetical protein [Candidatus Lokiarchaeota archaeon]